MRKKSSQTVSTKKSSTPMQSHLCNFAEKQLRHGDGCRLIFIFQKHIISAYIAVHRQLFVRKDIFMVTDYWLLLSLDHLLTTARQCTVTVRGKPLVALPVDLYSVPASWICIHVALDKECLPENKGSSPRGSSKTPYTKSSKLAKPSAGSPVYIAYQQIS